MELKIIEKRVKERQRELLEIKKFNDTEIQLINEELQKDYQKLIFFESRENDEAARLNIKDLRSKVIEQQDLVKKYLQIRYARLVNKSAPKIPVLKNALAAFFVGGTICVIGQIILNVIVINGVPNKEATTITLMVMVFISALLTGMGIYDEIGRFGGAGSIIPITGFANSIVSPALEYKREGYVYGVGAKVFTIAGPVLLYGSLMSVIIGLVFFIIK